MLDNDLIDDLWADASSTTEDTMDVHQFARTVEQAAYEAAIKACTPHEDDDALDCQAKRECIDAIRSLMEEPT